jgi:dCMP deaminase
VNPSELRPGARLSRDEYFMGIARTVARRGTCSRAYVGAVVVSSRNRILGTGYNGSPPGHPHCLDVGCKTIVVENKTYCIRTIHAEVNAVLTVQDHSDRLTLYTTHHPCFECIKVLAAKGIQEVKYLEEYTDPKWEMIRNEYRGISFIRLQ